MSSENPTPYVHAEVVQGRLVRVCPACKEQIVEHTDAEGMVSDHFAEHYEAEHPPVVEPERLQYYVFQNEMQAGPEVARNVADQALRIMRKTAPRHPDGKPINWTLADRLEDLPEGAPTVTASAVVHRLFDDDGGGIPLRQRQGDELVPIPLDETEEERERRLAVSAQKRDALSKRRLAANQVLIAHREHGLPKLRIRKADEGTDAAMEAYEAWRERREPLEAKITKKLDDAWSRSFNRLWNGRDDWREPLDEAIVAAKISEDEIAAEIAAMAEREARMERMLAERS